MNQSIPIISFTPKACLHRWKMRAIVDEYFARKYRPIKNSDGSTRMPSRKEKEKWDTEARRLWRTVVLESNNM